MIKEKFKWGITVSNYGFSQVISNAGKYRMLSDLLEIDGEMILKA